MHVGIAVLLVWLQDSQAFEYTRPSVKDSDKAQAKSRFDALEFTAIFGSFKAFKGFKKFSKEWAQSVAAQVTKQMVR